jgi:hypothetical protein
MRDICYVPKALAPAKTAARRKRTRIIVNCRVCTSVCDSAGVVSGAVQNSMRHPYGYSLFCVEVMGQVRASGRVMFLMAGDGCSMWILEFLLRMYLILGNQFGKESSSATVTVLQPVFATQFLRLQTFTMKVAVILASLIAGASAFGMFTNALIYVHNLFCSRRKLSKY